MYRPIAGKAGVGLDMALGIATQIHRQGDTKSKIGIISDHKMGLALTKN